MILDEDLKKKKVCARFVPRFLTPDQKHQRAPSSVEFVEMTDDDRNVLNRIVTVDESCCFMYDSGNKTSECNLVELKKPKAQKMRTQKSRVKKF
jgi:hypothetical protein